jgi:dihydrofolate reductase
MGSTPPTRGRAKPPAIRDIAGGASTVRQALIAGVVDELSLDIAPVLLGSGERIFDGVESLGMAPVEVLHSPLATHIRYRRVAS